MGTWKEFPTKTSCGKDPNDFSPMAAVARPGIVRKEPGTPGISEIVGTFSTTN